MRQVIQKCTFSVPTMANMTVLTFENDSNYNENEFE